MAKPTGIRYTSQNSFGRKRARLSSSQRRVLVLPDDCFACVSVQRNPGVNQKRCMTNVEFQTAPGLIKQLINMYKLYPNSTNCKLNNRLFLCGRLGDGAVAPAPGSLQGYCQSPEQRRVLFVSRRRGSFSLRPRARRGS